NFEQVPLVTSRDDLWHQKYGEDEQGRPVLRTLPPSEAPRLGAGDIAELETADGNGEAPSGDGEGAAGHGEEGVEEHGEEHAGGHGIHMPSPSYYPLVASLALPVVAYGMIYKAWYVAAVGAAGLLATLYSSAL